MALALPSHLVDAPKRMIRGMRFDGSTTYGKVANAALPSAFFSSTYTIHAVLRRRGSYPSGTAYIFHLGTSGGDGPLRMQHSESTAGFLAGRDSGTDLRPNLRTNKTLDTTTAHTVQFVLPNSLSAGAIDAYYDGVRASEDAINDGTGSLVTTTSGDFWIGRRSDGSYSFNGDLCVLALWSRTLTAGQIISAAINGPLTEQASLLCCIVEGNDIGPHRLPIQWTNLLVGDLYSVAMKGY
jgi:hypothetical protein